MICEMPLSYRDYDYDDEVFFDSDDPDFCDVHARPTVRCSEAVGHHPNRSSPILIPRSRNNNTSSNNNGKRSSSLTTSVMRQSEVKNHSPSHHQQWGIITLEDIRNQYHNTQAVLTLEELKSHYNSCFSCGVSWSEDHVSLDCFECGGYSMQRPCPVCDGKCNQIWRRDLAVSHSMQKAHWEGECGHRSSIDRSSDKLFINVSVTEEKLTEALKDLNAS